MYDLSHLTPAIQTHFFPLIACRDGPPTDQEFMEFGLKYDLYFREDMAYLWFGSHDAISENDRALFVLLLCYYTNGNKSIIEQFLEQEPFCWDAEGISAAVSFMTANLPRTLRRDYEIFMEKYTKNEIPALSRELTPYDLHPSAGLNRYWFNIASEKISLTMQDAAELDLVIEELIERGEVSPYEPSDMSCQQENSEPDSEDIPVVTVNFDIPIDSKFTVTTVVEDVLGKEVATMPSQLPTSTKSSHPPSMEHMPHGATETTQPEVSAAHEEAPESSHPAANIKALVLPQDEAAAPQPPPDSTTTDAGHDESPRSPCNARPPGKHSVDPKPTANTGEDNATIAGGSDKPLPDTQTDDEIKDKKFQEEQRKRIIAEFAKIVPEVVDPFATEDAVRRYTPDDKGFANLYSDIFRARNRHCPEAKEWLHYNGAAWKIDVGGVTAREDAKKFATFVNRLSLTIGDENYQRAFRQYAQKLGDRKKREDMLRDAESVFPLFLAQLDMKRDLFNCKNGTLNTRTFLFMPHNPDDLLSKTADVIYDPNAECPRWVQANEEIFEGDNDTNRYNQKALGYALLEESPKEECMFEYYGKTTRNGKSTILSTVDNIAGDYGSAAQPEILAAKRFHDSGGPSEYLARLRGVRFVAIAEPPKHMQINESIVKQLTGRDPVNARFLNQNSFVYVPQFVIFVNTNHRLLVSDDSLFASGRIREIPFNRHFKPNEQDKGLKDLFQTEEAKSGILNWLIEGLKAYRQHGFNPPQTVIAATEEYREESDDILRFMNEMTEVDSNSREQTSIIYGQYSEWCKANQLKIDSITNFVKDLKAKGYHIESCRFNGSNTISHVFNCKLKVIIP